MGAEERRTFRIDYDQANLRFVVTSFLQLLIETLHFGFERGVCCSRLEFRSPVSMHKFPGGLTARVTPVPIPNTEVKPCRADDTALETARERRSPPGLNFKGRSEQSGRPFSLSLRAISPS